MILENEHCRIEITTDVDYVTASSQDRYDLNLNPGNYDLDYLSKTFSIHVNLSNVEYRIALTGSYLADDAQCAVLEGDILSVLQGEAITRIHIRNRTLLQYLEFDIFGGGFSLFKVDQGYLIHGESQIIMLDFDFQKKWDYSGRDIFVTQTNEPAFKMCSDAIHLQDFEGNKYVINYEGETISYIPSCIGRVK